MMRRSSLPSLPPLTARLRLLSRISRVNMISSTLLSMLLGLVLLAVVPRAPAVCAQQTLFTQGCTIFDVDSDPVTGSVFYACDNDSFFFVDNGVSLSLVQAPGSGSPRSVLLHPLTRQLYVGGTNVQVLDEPWTGSPIRGYNTGANYINAMVFRPLDGFVYALYSQNAVVVRLDNASTTVTTAFGGVVSWLGQDMTTDANTGMMYVASSAGVIGFQPGAQAGVLSAACTGTSVYSVRWVPFAGMGVGSSRLYVGCANGYAGVDLPSSTVSAVHSTVTPISCTQVTDMLVRSSVDPASSELVVQCFGTGALLYVNQTTGEQRVMAQQIPSSDHSTRMTFVRMTPAWEQRMQSLVPGIDPSFQSASELLVVGRSVGVCAPGWIGANGLWPCMPCPAGSWLNAAGQTTCAVCPAGTFERQRACVWIRPSSCLTLTVCCGVWS